MDAATIVKRIRVLSGITRKELAELADLSPSTVGRIEQGRLDPTWGTLSRILESTGYRISGDTIVSAGDTSAVMAAKPILNSVIDAYTPQESLSLETLTADGRKWWDRWTRTGWLSARSDADALVTLAATAGNAAKVARRAVVHRTVATDDGWLGLARRLGEAQFNYAVSGLVATRNNRTIATSLNPLIYVEDPAYAVEKLSLKETSPGSGAVLIAPRVTNSLRLRRKTVFVSYPNLKPCLMHSPGLGESRIRQKTPCGTCWR